MDKFGFNEFIDRADLFQQAVASHIANLSPAEGSRYEVAFQAAQLSIEHAIGSLLLTRSGLFPTAYALMRTQYESLVRGIWLLYAASETWVEKLGEPLTLESAKRANEGLGLSDMLKQLENSSGAPTQIIIQLQEFKEFSWKAMCSYTHGGLHPLSRVKTGYPVELIFNAVRNSNAIVALACQLASILTGDVRHIARMKNFHTEFSDCLPLV
jgi:hypothetical protein